MSDDTISRQAAIDMLKNRWKKTRNYEGIGDDIAEECELCLKQVPSAQPEPLTLRINHELTKEEYDKLMQDIKDAPVMLLPSAQPERWIPCSERLPEIGQSVLLSVGGMYSAEGCLREDGDWAQFRWDAIQRKDMVGAWKPLPEPYKGEQE